MVLRREKEASRHRVKERKQRENKFLRGNGVIIKNSGVFNKKVENIWA